MDTPLKKLIEQVVREELEDLDESPENRGAFAQDLRSMGLGKEEYATKVSGYIKIGRPLKQLFNKHADHEWLSKLITIHSLWDPLDFFKNVTSRDEVSCAAFLPEHHFTQTDIMRFAGIVVKGHITYLANSEDDVYSGFGAEYTEVDPERTRNSGANKGLKRRFNADKYEGPATPLVLDKSDWNKHQYINNEALVDNWRPVAIVFSDIQKLSETKRRLKEQGTDLGIPLLTIDEFNKLI